jgi:hypothetical protein
MWNRAFIANRRGNQSSFYNGLDFGIHSVHIHASKKQTLGGLNG